VLISFKNRVKEDIVKKILFVLVSSVVILTMLFSGCSNRSVEAGSDIPPVDWVTARTADGNGVITLVMQTYENSITIEDIQYIKEYTESLLETVYDPGYPKVVATPELSDGARIVAYCYAVYSDRVPNSFTGTAGNERSGDALYRDAMEWFTVELAGEVHY
jgi:hypothetical protein